MLNKTIQMPLPDIPSDTEMASVEGDVNLKIEFLNMLSSDGMKIYSASTFTFELIEDDDEQPFIRITSNALDNVMDISIANLLTDYVSESDKEQPEILESSVSQDQQLQEVEEKELVIPDWAMPAPTASLSDFKKQLRSSNSTLLEWMSTYGSEVKAVIPDAAVFMEL